MKYLTEQIKLVYFDLLHHYCSLCLYVQPYAVHECNADIHLYLCYANVCYSGIPTTYVCIIQTYATQVYYLSLYDKNVASQVYNLCLYYTNACYACKLSMYQTYEWCKEPICLLDSVLGWKIAYSSMPELQYIIGRWRIKISPTIESSRRGQCI